MRAWWGRVVDEIVTWLIWRLVRFGGVHRYISTSCVDGAHDYCVAPTVTRDGRWQVLGPSHCSERDEPKNPAACKSCGQPCRCPICRRVGRDL